MQEDLLLALETSESTRQEALELRGRIKELEAQLAEIQNLLRLRNAEVERMNSPKTPPGVVGEVTLEVVPPNSVVDSKVLADSVSGELSPEATMETQEDGSPLENPPLLEALPAAESRRNAQGFNRQRVSASI